MKYAAEFGFAVFPQAGDCKTPLTRHGAYGASTVANDITRMWRNNRNANLAIACGSASEVLVLDVDAHPNGANGWAALAELEDRHGILPLSWRTRTPGRGCHLWFRDPVRGLKNGPFLPGLEVKTNGGAVTVPPSRRHDGQYLWEVAPGDVPLADAPDWLLDLMVPPRPVRPLPRSVRIAAREGAARYASRAVDLECSRLAAMGPSTGRNLRLFQASANLGELVGADMVSEEAVRAALESAAEACGLMGEDGLRSVLKTIQSGMGRGMAHPREVIR